MNKLNRTVTPKVSTLTGAGVPRLAVEQETCIGDGQRAAETAGKEIRTRDEHWGRTESRGNSREGDQNEGRALGTDREPRKQQGRRSERGTSAGDPQRAAETAGKEIRTRDERWGPTESRGNSREGDQNEGRALGTHREPRKQQGRRSERGTSAGDPQKAAETAGKEIRTRDERWGPTESRGNSREGDQNEGRALGTHREPRKQQGRRSERGTSAGDPQKAAETAGKEIRTRDERWGPTESRGNSREGDQNEGRALGTDRKPRKQQGRRSERGTSAGDGQRAAETAGKEIRTRDERWGPTESRGNSREGDQNEGRALGTHREPRKQQGRRSERGTSAGDGQKAAETAGKEIRTRDERWGRTESRGNSREGDQNEGRALGTDREPRKRTAGKEIRTRDERWGPTESRGNSREGDQNEGRALGTDREPRKQQGRRSERGTSAGDPQRAAETAGKEIRTRDERWGPTERRGNSREGDQNEGRALGTHREPRKQQGRRSERGTSAGDPQRAAETAGKEIRTRDERWGPTESRGNSREGDQNEGRALGTHREPRKQQGRRSERGTSAGDPQRAAETAGKEIRTRDERWGRTESRGNSREGDQNEGRALGTHREPRKQQGRRSERGTSAGDPQRAAETAGKEIRTRDERWGPTESRGNSREGDQNEGRALGTHREPRKQQGRRSERGTSAGDPQRAAETAGKEIRTRDERWGPTESRGNSREGDQNEGRALGTHREPRKQQGRRSERGTSAGDPQRAAETAGKEIRTRDERWGPTESRGNSREGDQNEGRALGTDREPRKQQGRRSERGTSAGDPQSAAETAGKEIRTRDERWGPTESRGKVKEMKANQRSAH